MIAEGVPLGEGGYLPVYLQPLYQKKIAFEARLPFTADYGKPVKYDKGLCPISEKMVRRAIFFYVQNWVPSKDDIFKFALAAEKF